MTEATSVLPVPSRIVLRKHRGEPVTVGDITVWGEALVLTVRLPSSAFVWQRPSAVLVG